jgi:hypothetical protein
MEEHNVPLLFTVFFIEVNRRFQNMEERLDIVLSASGRKS